MATSSPKYLKPLLIGAALTTVCSGVGIYAWREQHREPLLEVHVFALKTGRAMFIRTPDDYRMLVDGGGNSQVVSRLTDIIPFYSRRIDAVMITNTDGKNVSGLVDILERYDIGRVYIPRYTLEDIGLSSSTDQIYKTFLETLSEKHIQSEKVAHGDGIKLGSDVTLSSFFPDSPDSFEYSKASLPELLFSIAHKGVSILFMGDASKKVQKYVASLSREVISGSDALIISHSAAPANMSDELLSASRPNFLIYEKTVSKKSPAGSKKKIFDPLAAILEGDRFNLKEVGTVKIVSDGEAAVIEAGD